MLTLGNGVLNLTDSRQNRLRLAQFALPNNTIATAILLVDFTIYLSSVFFAVIADHLILKIVCATVAGFFIAQLFVIGHDAAHGAYVSSRRANAIIARLTFMPALHNYTLWLFTHNRLHHAFTNVKNYNSWSPMSFEEFLTLPRWRQILERIYRTPIGLGLYYLKERWYRDKLIPRKHIPTKYHHGGWKDFGLNMLFAAGLITGVLTLAVYVGQNAIVALLCAFVIPFVVWNYAMGLTTYQQHTHSRLPWYRNFVESRQSVRSAGEVSIYMQYPRWYLFITHNCYFHPVHHVNARIPLYRLQEAQIAYMQLVPELTHTIPFTFKEFLQTMKTCKLYNYQQQQWLDFSGNPTTAPTITTVPQVKSATVLPLRYHAENK